MQIVDTNVLTYLFLEGQRTQEARALYDHDPDWQSEEFALVEFSNMLATAVRVRKLNAAQALELLNDMSSLLAERLHRVPHADALSIAMQYAVTAYDARYLALAQSIDQRLVTEDLRLRAAVPALTQSIADALRSVDANRA